MQPFVGPKPNAPDPKSLRKITKVTCKLFGIIQDEIKCKQVKVLLYGKRHINLVVSCLIKSIIPTLN